jgi:LPPG:FO 2-phospho-L-lactate transferase
MEPYTWFRPGVAAHRPGTPPYSGWRDNRNDRDTAADRASRLAFYARTVLVTLCGGVGAARMLSGLVRVQPPESLTAIINVGDDTILHGLHISPDIDTITYTLAGMDNRETGWGVAGESWIVMDELARLGGESWFRLGDRDLATHLFRTERLRAGDSLTDVTTAIAARRKIQVRLLPVTDDSVRTMLTLARETDLGRAGTEVAFQDYFVRLHHDVAVGAVRFAGAESAHPTPAVLAALTEAKQIIVCPSNPIVSIGPLLAIPGMLDILTARRGDVIAVSPIVAGAALKGPADRLMAELGTEPSVVGVAQLYAPWVSTLVIDEADRARAAAVEAEGVRCVVAPTIMDSPERAAAVARAVIDAGE